MAVGLGCMLAFSRAFASGFASNIPMSATFEMGTFSFACSAVRIAAIAGMVLLGCAYRVSIGRAMLIVSGVVMAVSGFVLSGGLGLAEGVPFALMAGIASGIVMLAMLMELSSMRISDIVFASFGGLAIGGMLIGGLMRLDALPATAILVLTGLLSGALLAVVDRTGDACRADGLPTASQVAAFPWFAAIMLALCGFLTSAFYGVAGTLGWHDAAPMNYPLFGIAVVVVLGVTTYIVMQGEETAGAAWIPLFALLLTTMVLACVDDSAVNPSVQGLLFAGVFAFHFLRWMVFPILISFSNVPRLFFCGLALIATSSFFGVGWGTSTAAMLPAGLREQSGFVALLAIALLMVFAAALFVNRARLERARMQLSVATSQLRDASTRIDALSQQADQVAQPQQSPVDERCEALVAAHGLTGREAEILLLTARGHSSTFIAEQLFISASTVRFHQQNIYRKLDVHSRQELLSLVNEEGVS